MKTISRIFMPAAAMMLSLAVYAPAYADGADNIVGGVKLGYASENSSMDLGVYLEAPVCSALRIAPELGVILRNENLDAFTVDINAHMPIDITSGSDLCIYPLVGLNCTSWNRHNYYPGTSDPCSRTTRWGMNLGAGLEYFINSRMALKAEWKYTLTKKYSQTVIDLGIGWQF